MSRRLLLLTPLCIVLILFFFFMQGLKQDPHLLPSNLINQQAPAFQLNELASTKSFNQKVFLHHNTLLNVWASWCESCQEEQVFLLQLRQQYPKLQIIGLNYKDTPQSAKSWLSRYGNPYHLVLEDKKGFTAIDYGVYGTPESFLIGPDGIVRAKHVGTLDASSFAKELLPKLE